MSFVFDYQQIKHDLQATQELWRIARETAERLDDSSLLTRSEHNDFFEQTKKQAETVIWSHFCDLFKLVELNVFEPIPTQYNQQFPKDLTKTDILNCILNEDWFESCFTHDLHSIIEKDSKRNNKELRLPHIMSFKILEDVNDYDPESGGQGHCVVHVIFGEHELELGIVFKVAYSMACLDYDIDSNFFTADYQYSSIEVLHVN